MQYYTNPVSGDDSNSGKSTSQAFKTLEKACQTAQTGDLIRVAEGEYREHFRPRVPELTFQGDGNPQNIKIKQTTIQAPDFTAQNMGFGSPESKEYAVRPDRQASGYQLLGCVIDAHHQEATHVFSVRTPSILPFNGECADHGLVKSCVLRGANQASTCDLFGSHSIIEECRFEDGWNTDWLRLFGRYNIIRNNIFEGSRQVEGGNHPDWIQTFTNDGTGSIGHAIYGNHVRDSANMQLSQLSNMGRFQADVVGGWFIFSNIFDGIGMQGSCTIPNMRYFLNTFHRCNHVNKGPVLSFGIRGYEQGDPIVHASKLHNGITYRVKSDQRDADNNRLGRIKVNGVELLPQRDYFTYHPDDVVEFEAPAYLVEFPLTYAHGAQAVGNIFLHCGHPRYAASGWYAFDPALQGVRADYNYVGKEGVNGESFLAVPERLNDWEIGAPELLSPENQREIYRFYEKNGLNGGDPGLDFEYGVQLEAPVSDYLPAQAIGITLPQELSQTDPRLRLDAWEDFTGAERETPFSLGALEGGFEPNAPETDPPVVEPGEDPVVVDPDPVDPVEEPDPVVGTVVLDLRQSGKVGWRNGDISGQG